ncbi:hypothetical protein [Mycolicibacterium sp. lyk4-40-TYG-92]|nr:hypothetical protein [Mycolicibacterium sp. lyk4-40-TYG-92]
MPQSPVHVAGADSEALAHSNRADRAAVLLETQQLTRELLGAQSK